MEFATLTGKGELNCLFTRKKKNCASVSGIMGLEKPVSFDENDPEKDAQLFFTLASCNPEQHLNNMMKLSEMLMNEEVVKALKEAKTPEDLLEIQKTYLDG